MSTFENTSEMYVTKRNGNKEIISFDKILQRIKKTGKDANIKINYTSLVIKIIDQLFDGIPTDKIDEISAEQCATMSSIHYDYGTLASRLIISNHHKNTSISFSKTMKRLYTEQMLSDVFMQNVNANAKQLDTLIDYNRDYLIDYFGFKTLERSYLMSIKKRVQERPQMMFLRLAVAIHGTDFQKIQETYHALSNKQMIHGTPSLYNAGTRREQMSSCFLRDTSVHTIGGPVPIQDVKEGYKVVTHTGEVQTVTQIHTNSLGNRKLYTVQFHRTRSFVVTEDHPLYVYDKLNETVVWKTVEELTQDDYVMIPKNKLHKYEFNQEHDVSKLVVDSDIQKFFGIWHRYGEYLYYSDTSGGTMTEPAGIQIVLPTDCLEAVMFCDKMKQLFGGVRMEKADYDNGVTVLRYELKKMATDFISWFGLEKNIPQSMYQHPTHWVRAFLSGWNVTECPLREDQVPDTIYTLCRINHLDHITFLPLNYVECDEVIEHEDNLFVQFLNKDEYHPLNVVSVAERSDDRRSSTTNVSGDKVTGDVLRISTHILKDDIGVQRNMDISGNEMALDGCGIRSKAEDIHAYSEERHRSSEEYENTPVYTLGVENDHSYSVAGVVAKNCYLIAMESDSIDGIYNTLKDCALISKYAGGIGLHIHNIRATGSHIAGTNGTSNGIVPMLRVFNNTAKYVDQCLHPLSTIYTTQGPMNIRNVIQGETEIYNQLGETEIVQNVLEHSYDGPMLHIQSEFSMDDLNITPEHPVFVLRGNGTEPHSNYTLKQMLEKQMLEPIWIEAGELDTTDLLAFPIPNYEKDVSNIHEEDCYLYGLLLCDGEFNDERGAFCTLTTHTPYTYEFVCGYLKLHCVDYSITKHEDVYTFVWKRPAHLPFRYRDLSGFIANRWLNLPIQKSQFILKGMMDSQHGTIGKQIQLQHMSKQIIECCRFLCLKMGILTHVRCSSSGYYLTIPVTQETCELFHLEHDGRESPFVRHENFLFSPIRYILSNEYKGVLYDLQMEKQHDYLLSNALVHNGGGKRNGSIAIYLEPWHADIELFLQLRKNHGEEELKARDLFYALWVPDLFMKRVKEAGKWTLFCPHECPGLADVHNEAFEKLYTSYEESGKGKATLNARDLWFKIMDAQMETGTPYLIYKDAANRKSNQQNLGTIKSSNLCAEIIEYSDEHETAVCNLCSIALPAFVVTDPSGVNPPTYDFEKLHQISRMATYNLNRVIDINYYPTEKTRRSNMRHRPIGIGVQGLADTFMMMGYTFGSPESRRLNQEIFETMYHGALVESCEIAQKEGAYETFEGSPASKGQLQFDLWDFTDPLHEDPNDPQSPHRYDWTSLKIQIQTYGLRNSLLLAPMPTASTSQILGYNECIEPITSNIYARRTLAGEFIITNKYLMKDLISLGLWNEKIKNNIVANFGSIQNIDIIPVEIREKYKTVWEIPMRTLIDMAAERGVYVDQSQSLNLWLEEPTYSTLTSMHFYSWSKGLKTGIYYLRRRARHAAQQFTIEPEKAQTHQEDEEEICEMCSG